MITIDDGGPLIRHIFRINDRDVSKKEVGGVPSEDICSSIHIYKYYKYIKLVISINYERLC